ncbi:PDDEXK nuclease domain-containing protein [Rhodococcus globerulus]|uniref:PDDEXK nuclease domain-containing protein n=1 Tax=Rhodococcus globerulus TaxID=33008 RepID=A0ABU4C367_RHOGO|nr:PDDEXK nuclease domain-containing protein [Rhodococcus globerulus]MDV6270946.1 PDDEXK nuclease domain-containing protein [Rhodococcus globerulus]
MTTSKREALLIEHYLSEQRALDEQLAAQYQELIENLDASMFDYLGVLERAFSPDIEIALLGSAELALELGVATEEFLNSDEKVLAYFLDYRDAIGQQPVGQLPWGHITVLLDNLDNLSDRDWYAATAAEHGWSRNVLHNQIKSGLRRRIGAAPSNFQDHLPAEDSDLAQQLVRDPYVFDFLDITERVGRTGTGICTDASAGAVSPRTGTRVRFVGRQYHFEVGDQDFYIDLLFFNWVQARFVVVELKVGRFEPEYVGNAPHTCRGGLEACGHRHHPTRVRRTLPRLSADERAAQQRINEQTKSCSR